MTVTQISLAHNMAQYERQSPKLIAWINSNINFVGESLFEAAGDLYAERSTEILEANPHISADALAWAAEKFVWEKICMHLLLGLKATQTDRESSWYQRGGPA
jgi:hypothetical protein